jgi:hypothetical protein
MVNTINTQIDALQRFSIECAVAGANPARIDNVNFRSMCATVWPRSEASSWRPLPGASPMLHINVNSGTASMLLKTKSPASRGFFLSAITPALRLARGRFV